MVVPSVGAQLVAPFRPQAAAPQPRAMAVDSVVLSPYATPAAPAFSAAPPPAPPTQDASDTPLGISPAARWILIGTAGLALVGAGIGVAHVVHQTPATEPPVISQPVHDRASTADIQILKGLDQARTLSTSSGPIDAYEALRDLEGGKPVQVGVARLGYHPSGHVDDTAGQATAETVKAQMEKVTVPKTVEIRSFRDLERLNAAERLTDVDTSASLTDAEFAILKALTPFEGGVASGHVDKIPVTVGVSFRYTADAPAPNLETSPHRTRFKAEQRLSAYEAMQRIEHGEPVAVRSENGLEQVIRRADQLGDLQRLEAPAEKAIEGIGLKTHPVDVVQGAILRELAAGKALHGTAGSPDVRDGQTLSAFQAWTELRAGRTVEVDLGHGLSARANSLQDLSLLNAEEGLTKVDTSPLLTPREQQTAAGLRLFEGRGADAGESALRGTWHSGVMGRDLPTYSHLNVRGARARLAGGAPLAVRTARGRVHVIRTVEELDTLVQLQQK